MDEFNFDTSYTYKGKEYEMLELFIDTPCFYKDYPDFRNNDDHYNEEYRFEADIYLKDKIYEFIKKPPKGSWIETEWKEYDREDFSSIEYASLKYVYKCYLKSHKEYAKKLDKLSVNKKFDKRCRDDFAKAFKDYKNKIEEEL